MISWMAAEWHWWRATEWVWEAVRDEMWRRMADGFEFDGAAGLGIIQNFQIAGIRVAIGKRVCDRSTCGIFFAGKLQAGCRSDGRSQTHGLAGFGIVSANFGRGVIVQILIGHFSFLRNQLLFLLV